jgi:hypothetical protein
MLMYTMLVKGNIDGHPVELEINVDCDGAALGGAIVSAYKEILVQAPSLISSLEKQVPAITKAMQKLHKAASA